MCSACDLLTITVCHCLVVARQSVWVLLLDLVKGDSII